MTDDVLWERWRAGDALAYEELFRRWSGRVAAFVARMLGDAHRAEEITQEVFMRVITHVESFDGQKAKVSTWLFQMARNLSLNAVRDAHRRGETTLSGAEREERVRPSGGEDMVRLALSGLSEEHRAVFVLKHDQELSYEEIGQALSIPVGTVKSRMYHAVRALREHLKGVRT